MTSHPRHRSPDAVVVPGPGYRPTKPPPPTGPEVADLLNHAADALAAYNQPRRLTICAGCWHDKADHLGHDIGCAACAAFGPFGHDPCRRFHPLTSTDPRLLALTRSLRATARTLR